MDKSWHEQSAFQSVGVRAVDWQRQYVFISFPPPSFFPRFLPRVLFSQKECSYQKTYLAKVDGSAQKPESRHLSRPCWPFWGPVAAILDLAGSTVLQAVSEHPRPLSWY